LNKILLSVGCADQQIASSNQLHWQCFLQHRSNHVAGAAYWTSS